MESSHDPMRTVRWAAIGLALVVGWFFILWQNDFHLTAPVVFVALGYLAVVALIVNMWKTGAMAAAPEQIGDEAWERPIGPREELEKEKRTLLKAIKEAEFDHEMGKLSKADADSMIATYRQRAIAVIKELDRMDPRSAPDEAYRGAMLTKREKIEREVKARLELAEKKAKPAKKQKNNRQDAEAAKQKSQAGKQPEAGTEAKKVEAKADAAKADDNVEAKQPDDKAEAKKAEAKAEAKQPDDKAEAKQLDTTAESAKANEADDKASAEATK